MKEYLFKFNKPHKKFIFKGYALFCIPLFFFCYSELLSFEHHKVDFDTTNNYFKGGDDYQNRVKNTVLQVIDDIEQLIKPKYDNQIKILVKATNKKIPTLAYMVPKYENILIFKNGINTGRVWQKYNTTNINPLDSTYDCELFINFNFDFNTVNSNFDKNKYDLYSIILHEYMHSLGFFSMITKNGTSIKTNYKQGIFSLFDSRLLADSNYLVSFNVNKFLEFNTALKPVLSEECSVNYMQELPIIFSPSDWQDGSSLSHIDTNCINKQFVMSPTVYRGQIKRIPLYEDLFIIATLGYDVTGVFQDDSILTKEELSKFSNYSVPIANNDYIDSIDLTGNNELKIPASLLMSNDNNIDRIFLLGNDFIKILNEKEYDKSDTILIELKSFKNPYKFNYFCKSKDGLISNPALVSISLPTKDNSINECRKEAGNLICNGDFEQVSSIGQLKLDSKRAPNYLYNRDDTFEPCVPSKFLAGWDLSLSPDVYTYLDINELPLRYDPNFSTKYKDNVYHVRYLNLEQIHKPYNSEKNNFFLGMFNMRYNMKKFENRVGLRFETISQELNGLDSNEKYKLSLDINPFPGLDDDSLHILFTKEKLCYNDTIFFPPKNERLLLSHRMDYNYTNNSDYNHGFEWQHITFNNLDLKGFNYIYIFSLLYSPDLGYVDYYFLDNISLKPMSYTLNKEDLNYNFCDNGFVDIPIRIEKEIKDADTLLVKVSNERLNFETDGKIIFFDKGTKDTTIYFTATYNNDYRWNPNYLIDVEFESNKKGNLGKDNITITISNNDLDIKVYSDNYCNEDSLFFYVEITQSDYNSIENGQIYVHLPPSLYGPQKTEILENSLDPDVKITTYAGINSGEPIYKIFLHNTLSKSTVHGIDEDLKLKIKFSSAVNIIDSIGIIKTVSNLFSDGCEKIQFDTIYFNSLRNRVMFNDTSACNLDLSYLIPRNIRVVDGPDKDDLLLSETGQYIISYSTIGGCVVLDTFNLTSISDFSLNSNVSVLDSSLISFKIETIISSKIDTISEITGTKIYKIYPVFEGRLGSSGYPIENLSPQINSYQIKDTFFVEQKYDILNAKYTDNNGMYFNVIINYPKSETIQIASSSKVFDGCNMRVDTSLFIYHIPDSLNRIFDYKVKNRLINIYPNPTDNELNVEFEVFPRGVYYFKIYDLLGREIYSESEYYNLGSYSKTISVKNMVNGTYTIMIVSPLKTYFYKFIIYK